MVLIIANTNDSIQHYSFICTQLNGFKYCYLNPINSQPLTTSTFKIKIWLDTCLPQEQLEEYIWDNHIGIRT